MAVIRNFLLLTGIGVVLVSCDKAGDADGSTSKAESNPRTRRYERPPLEAQGTRGKLQASLDAAKKIEAAEEREKAIIAVGWSVLEPAPDLTAEAIRELPVESPEAAELMQACVANLMKMSSNEAWLGRIP